MKKMTYSKLKEIFREYERKNRDHRKHLTGYIVFTESSFKTKDGFIEELSEQSRTYVVNSNDKAFNPESKGYTVFGYCLADANEDEYIELYRYMADERGGQNGWIVDYCYIEDENVIKDIQIEEEKYELIKAMNTIVKHLNYKDTNCILNPEDTDYVDDEYFHYIAADEKLFNKSIDCFKDTMDKYLKSGFDVS